MDNKLDTANRRTTKRKPARGTVRIECRRSDDDANLAVGVLDLCEGGVRLLSRYPLQDAEDLEVSFEAFGVPSVVRRSARVVWSLSLPNQHVAAGLEFRIRLSQEELQQLSRS